MSRPTDPAQQVTIRAYPDGPLLVRGDFVLKDCADQPVDASRSVVALCRCGRSGNAPLCDGSHRASQRPRSSSNE